MGLSTSQARLLSITARLSDNELHSQQIANAKVRLADQTQEASREYVNSLDAQKLVFTTYDAKGNSKQVNLTPAIIYDYAEMKNQYGIVNNAGQLLVSTQDAKNYKESKNVTEFIQKYGIELKYNDSYNDAIAAIYGEENISLFDSNNPNEYIEGNTYYSYLSAKLNDINGAKFATLDEYENLRTNVQNSMSDVSAIDNLDEEDIGYFQSYINSINNMPEFDEVPPDYDEIVGDEPKKSDYITVKLLDDYEGYLDPLPDPDLFPYAVTLIKPACWNDTKIYNPSNPADPNTLYNNQNMVLADYDIWHVEHVLAQYLWDGKSSYDVDNGTDQYDQITIKGETITNKYTDWAWGITSGGASSSSSLNTVDPKGVQTILAKDAALGNNGNKLRERLRELYVQVLYKIQDAVANGDLPSSYDIQDGTVTNNGKIAHATNKEISVSYYNLMKDILQAVAEDIYQAGESDPRWSDAVANYGAVKKANEDQNQAIADENAARQKRNAAKDQLLDDQTELYNKKYDEYEERIEKYNELEAEYEAKLDGFLNTTAKQWLTNVKFELDNYRRFLSYIPNEYIINDADPKTQWYINLWHRMNGASDENVNLTVNANNEMVLGNTTATSGPKWKILEDNLLKSSSWLQFALEQGLVTLEQVQRVDEAEDDTGLTNVKWASKIYTTCTDIQFVDDEAAIARAEAEYTRKLNDIEAKDKKYDSDIKKLDTEHNALQTEYESVKSVVDKNIERSFKAFS